jgi:hypothetical protein
MELDIHRVSLGVVLLLNYSTIAAMRYRKHFILGDLDGKPTDL